VSQYDLNDREHFVALAVKVAADLARQN